MADKMVFVQFRLTVEQRRRLDAVARANFLQGPTWAKQQVLRALVAAGFGPEAVTDLKARALDDERFPLKNAPPLVPFDGEEDRR
jgi:hypothetical protein